MQFSDIKLPSNKKFGFFFSAIFFIVFIWFVYMQYQIASYVLFIISSIFLLITIFKANFLLPLNKLWMRFGLVLGKIISPIVIAFIFFGLITPYGVILRFIGRDELRLKKTKKESHWTHRSENSSKTDFKQQF